MGRSKNDSIEARKRKIYERLHYYPPRPNSQGKSPPNQPLPNYQKDKPVERGDISMLEQVIPFPYH